MNGLRRFLPWIALLLIALLLSTGSGGSVAHAAAPAKTIIANTFTLADGEMLNEDLTILAGTVTLEKGSTMNGNISLAGGTLQVAGLVKGNITATGGTIALKSSAHVTGDISLTGVAFSRADGAQVDGSTQSLERGLPAIPGIPEVSWSRGLNPFWEAVWFLARIFIFSALAVLAAMFFPRQLERTSRAIVAQPLTGGLLGLLTVVVAPFVVLLLLITIILSPVAVLGVLALGLIILFGWIALGLETGRRLASAMSQEWAVPLAAGLGTLLLTFVLLSINFIPCIGWVFPFAAGLVGLGAALLTVIGTRDYPAPLGLLPSLSPADANVPLANTSSTDLMTSSEPPTDPQI